MPNATLFHGWNAFFTPRARGALGGVALQYRQHRVPPHVVDAKLGVDPHRQSSVKNQSLFSRRDAIRMKMRDAVSRKG